MLHYIVFIESSYKILCSCRFHGVLHYIVSSYRIPGMLHYIVSSYRIHGVMLYIVSSYLRFYGMLQKLRLARAPS